MSDLNHQIHLALRTAAGHARAAHDAQAAADKTYEMKMKSAGAAVYEAWALTVRSQPEYQGRKIDDKALVRIYESTKPRPWWDKHLSTIKVEGKPADREWATRTLQWHLDPDAARARRAHAVVKAAGHRRRMKEDAERGRGIRTPQAGAPTTAEVRKVGKAVELGMGYGPATAGELAKGYGGGPQLVEKASRDAIDRLLERARQATRGMSDVKLAEAETLLRDLVEQLEDGL